MSEHHRQTGGVINAVILSIIAVRYVYDLEGILNSAAVLIDRVITPGYSPAGVHGNHLAVSGGLSVCVKLYR